MADKNNPFKFAKKPTETVVPVVEETIVPVVVPVVEVVVEKQEAPITESVEVNEPIKEPAETKKKAATTKSRKKPTKSEKEDEVVTEDEDVDVPRTEISYAEVVLAIKSSFVDEEWEIFKTETSARLGEIHITNDMTPGALKQIISDLNSLRDSVWFHFLDCKTFFENLTAKEDGLLDRVKRLHSKGTNDNERKINSSIALMNYKEDGKSINLYEVLDASRARFNYTKGLMDSIQYKSNSVITMLGNLKLEK